MSAPQFDLGGVMMNLGALSYGTIQDLLDRHAAGDWGDVTPEQRAENEQTLQHGGEHLVSAYNLTEDVTVEIETIGSPRLTFVSVPDEYETIDTSLFPSGLDDSAEVPGAWQ